MAERASVGEAPKLVYPIKENKREVLPFISIMDTAFEVMKPKISQVL